MYFRLLFSNLTYLTHPIYTSILIIRLVGVTSPQVSSNRLPMMIQHSPNIIGGWCQLCLHGYNSNNNNLIT